jgi:predicted DNA-binding protein
MDEITGYNRIYTDTEYYDAVINHLNKIQEIPDKKKFEWEDQPPTETYKITYNLDEWLDYSENSLKIFNKHVELEDGGNNIREKLIEYEGQLRQYFDGYLLDNVGMYNGIGFFVCSFASDNFEDIISFAENTRKSCEKVFLREIIKYYIKEFPDYELRPDAKYSYKLCYGAIKSLSEVKNESI